MSKIKIFSFKIADFLFVFLFVVTIIYFSANIFLNKKSKTKQLIIESGKNIWYYQLDKNKKIEIQEKQPNILHLIMEKLRGRE